MSNPQKQFLQHWVDTAVIIAVVVINALIGFIQEGKAEKALDAIRTMLSPTATVLRDGERLSIAGEALVPGDIILLEAGDKVPADVRLIKSHGLTVQEAILTGESIPVEKHIHPVPSDVPLGDRTCMAFSGTLVTNGQGKGIVVATGSSTQIGHISGLLSRVESLTTPLFIQMGLFAKWLTLFILLVVAILLAYGYFVQHHPFGELFMSWLVYRFLALLFGLSLPVTPIQILWINLITAVTLGIALAFEPTEEGTMHRPPRPRNESLLTGSLVWHIILVSILFICGVFGLYFYALDRGYSLELARTIALNTLVVLEIFHLFYIRNIYSTSLTWKAVQGTKVVWMAVIAITVAQFAITYFSPLQTLFVTESIPFGDGVLIIITGAIFFAVIEIEKQLRLRISVISHISAGKNAHYGDGVL